MVNPKEMGHVAYQFVQFVPKLDLVNTFLMKVLTVTLLKIYSLYEWTDRDGSLHEV
jgi:hypothetical protein